MKITGIYKIQSKLKPKRIYIGSAVNISERWRLHLLGLRNNKHHSKKLQRHYNKYGKSDLKVSILIGCERDELLKYEQYFIDSYNPYFNTCVTAGSNLGLHWSEKTRKQISKTLKGNIPWNKGKPRPKEYCEKQSKTMKGRVTWNKGIPCREETKLKLREIRLGSKMSKESSLKKSMAMKGKKHPMFGKHHTEETKKKMRKKHVLSDKAIKALCHPLSEAVKSKISRTKKAQYEEKILNTINSI